MKRSGLIVALAIVAAIGCAYAFRWAIVNAAVRREFPDVQRITTAELAAWMANETRAAPLLLDTRSRAEYNVSHLAGAHYAGSDSDFQVPEHPKDRPIVTYCSVGYRSARFARQLQTNGYTNVRNLEGSIFQWANEGRPAHRGEVRVNEVHPYNGTWSWLLTKQYRARLSTR